MKNSDEGKISMKKDKLNTLIQEDFSFAIIDKSKDKLIIYCQIKI